jgi:ABC-2 type transport system ATP-binding protein
MDQMADEVVVIDHGRLVRQGSIADLTGGRSSLWVSSADHAGLGRALIAAGVEPRPDGHAGYTVTGAPADLVGEIALHAGVALTELTPRETTLEDAFLELTEGAGR